MVSIDATEAGVQMRVGGGCLKVFISWSGDVSREIALALRDWMPQVLQVIEPWVSDHDIDKGAPSVASIQQALTQSAFGIVCVTRDNMEAAWLNYELGALSREVDEAKTHVSPFLLDLQPSDVSGPLSNFQMTKATEGDVGRLLDGMNKRAGEVVPAERLARTIKMWWPELQSSLSNILARAASSAPAEPVRSDRQLLEEILDTVRAQRNRGERWSESGQLRPRKGSVVRTSAGQVVHLPEASASSPAPLADLQALLRAFDEMNNGEAEVTLEGDGRVSFTIHSGNFLKNPELIADLDVPPKWSAILRDAEGRKFAEGG